MKQVMLGASGPQVSVVGLGCNNFASRIDLEQTRRVVHKALDLGITLFDTADRYGNFGGSETFLGHVLGPRRKEIILATNFGGAMNADEKLMGASRRYILSAVEASLRRLQTDWIDLYQLHYPDPQTPIEETLRALDDLVQQGKVRHIGTSNMPAWQVVDAVWTARHQGLTAFASCQDEYSLLVRDAEEDLLPAMRKFGLSLLPYFPLASGLLSGKYRRDQTPAPGTRMAEWKRLGDRYLTEGNWRIVERLDEFCRARNRTLLELAFSWLAARPAVSSVIAGATRPEQVEQNVRAAEWALSADEIAEIDRLTQRQ